MAGTPIGGLKASKTNLAKDPEFYSKLGKLGGKSGKAQGSVKGFAQNKERARTAGRKGGLIAAQVRWGVRKPKWYEFGYKHYLKTKSIR